MASSSRARSGPEVSSEHVDQVVTGTQLVGALIAESLANVRPLVTMPQWRVLVLASGGNCNVSAVAEDLHIHISSATRTCDRLVAAGLIERRRAADDKRHILLRLTPAGRRLFNKAMDYRRRRLEGAMALLPEADQADLARCFALLAAAAEEVKMTKAKRG